MKLFDKVNVTMGICAVITGALFAITPTLFAGTCFGFCVGTFVADTIFNWKHRQENNMFGFYILILLGCVVVGMTVAGRFGDKLHDKAEDIKNIYTTEEGEETNEQER